MRYHRQAPNLLTVPCETCDGQGCNSCSFKGTVSPYTPAVGAHAMLAFVHEPDDPVGLIVAQHATDATAIGSNSRTHGTGGTTTAD